MGRRKPSKSHAPRGTGRKTVGEGVAAAAQAAEPPKVQMPSWFDGVPSYLALAFIALALATIPYGAPMPAWYMWTMAAVGVALAMSLATDPKRRWRQMTIWPVPVILGAWACAIAACDFPRDVLGRSWGMAGYSAVFVAAQVLCWSRSGIRALALGSLATVVLIALDLWFQGATARSLLREVRWPEMRWMGNHWNWNYHTGSIANANDHAVVAVLLPLCTVTLPTAWSWGLVATGFGAGTYDLVITKSRQLLAGLMVGGASCIALHLPRRLRWWAAGSLIVLVLGVALLHPDTRSKLLALASSPLAGRSILVVFGLNLFLTHPVFGVGPSLYGHYHAMGVREGWTFRGESIGEYGIPWVHCLPVEVACELGMTGLLCYGVVLLAFTRRLVTSYRAGGAARDLSIAVASSALAMAVMGLVDLAFIKDWVRICWWLLLGLGFAAPMIQEAQGKPMHPTRPFAKVKGHA